MELQPSPGNAQGDADAMIPQLDFIQNSPLLGFRNIALQSKLTI
jgi:hypothetical protein